MTAVTVPGTGLRTAEAVARFALREQDDGHDADQPAAPLPPQEWNQLVATCRAERTTGLLAAALTSGWMPATDEQATEIDSAHAMLMGTVVILEQVLVAAAACLDAAGIRHRVLKGSANAWLDWPEPSLRTFRDVDILLADRYDDGLRALEAFGCRRLSVEVHEGFDRRFGKGTTLVGPTSHEVDVHRTLAAGAYGLLIKRDELLDGGERLVIGGGDLLALPRPQRLVHACYHAALGGVRARHATLRDVGELLLASEAGEQRSVLELARSWGGSAPVASAIGTATALLGLPPGHPLVRWARGYQPSSAERRRLRAYSGEGRSFAAQAIEGWQVLPTISDRVAYAAQLLFPDPDHLRARGESGGHRWVRAAHIVRDLVRRR